MEVVQDLYRMQSVTIADDLAAMSVTSYADSPLNSRVAIKVFGKLMNSPSPIDEVSTHFMSSEDFRRWTYAASQPTWTDLCRYLAQSVEGSNCHFKGETTTVGRIIFNLRVFWGMIRICYSERTAFCQKFIENEEEEISPNPSFLRRGAVRLNQRHWD